MSQLNSRGAQPAGPLLFWELTLSIDANDLGSINKEMIIGI